MPNQEDPALLDFPSTRESYDRLSHVLEDMAATAHTDLNPEAASLRSLMIRASIRLDSREVRAADSNYYEREIQFLVDLRAAIDQSLENAVPWAQKREGVTWQRLGDLLGVSRQSAHEKYAV